MQKNRSRNRNRQQNHPNRKQGGNGQSFQSREVNYNSIDYQDKMAAAPKRPSHGGSNQGGGQKRNRSHQNNHSNGRHRGHYRRDRNDRHRSHPFEKLTAVQPREKLQLETEETNDLSMRILEMVAPIGKGQRGLIVAPPRSGKTILLQKIALAVGRNHPEVQGFVLLVDERPEEVTDFRRSLTEVNFEVVASSNDMPPKNHIQITEQTLRRAKDLVVKKKDVVLLFDSLTRMTRAYNTQTPNNSRTMSGGIDAAAFQGPRSFFGAARQTEEGGSLTIIGSVLTETGSRMDQVIFEEFKGTGNMELYLDRELADQRIFPAFDLMRSGTRREELLVDDTELARIHRLRRALADRKSADGMKALISHMEKTKTNREFLKSLA